MPTAEAPQTPEQHLGSGSEKFRGLHLTEGTQMCVAGVGGCECARNIATRNSLSTGLTSGGRDRRPDRCWTSGVRSWGSMSLGTEGFRRQEIRGQGEIRPKEGNLGSESGHREPPVKYQSRGTGQGWMGRKGASQGTARYRKGGGRLRHEDPLAASGLQGWKPGKGNRQCVYF